MKFTDLDQSIMECQRYLGKAMALRAAWKASKDTYNPPSGTLSAAVKRASMDLSKQLAQLRKG